MELNGKRTKEQVSKNARLILVILGFIISLFAVSFLTFYFLNQKYLQEREAIELRLQKCEEVSDWRQEWLSKCEEKARKYRDILEEHNLPFPN